MFLDHINCDDPRDVHDACVRIGGDLCMICLAF